VQKLNLVKAQESGLLMSKTNLTKEQVICDMYALHYQTGEWCRYLIIERGLTVDEYLAAMQRMVDYVQDKKEQ